MLDRFLSAGVGVAVVARGSLGSLAATREERAETGIKDVDVVDTTGAGDSFIAGFLSVRLRGGMLQAAVEAGRDQAALACSHVGGFPQALQLVLGNGLAMGTITAVLANILFQHLRLGRAGRAEDAPAA